MPKVKKIKLQKGFTLVELLIVLVILGVLATLAVPAYLEQSKRTKFAEVVNATSPYKLAVEACYIARGALADCDAGAYGVPAAVTGGDGYLNDISVTDGVITADGDGGTFGYSAGSTEYTYILTPTTASSGASLTWAATGTCSAPGYC